MGEKRGRPTGIEMRNKPEVTKEQKREIDEYEQHLLEIWGAESFEEAMKDETNFFAFVSDIETHQGEFDSEEFIQLLIIAATTSPENAQFFLDSLDDLKEVVEDKKGLRRVISATKLKLK